MAEFKLGRIRFIWKNDWIASTVYYNDDIVRNGGNTYVCVAGHTAPALFTTLETSYWDKISDGTEWKSDWAVGTYYKVNDIVKYGGYLYVANQGHTGAATAALGLENDQSKWDLYAEGFDYKTDWAISTRYKVNDFAKYHGTVYICTSAHTSAATLALGLESDDGRILTINTISAADAARTAGTYTALAVNGGAQGGHGAIATAVVNGSGAVTVTLTSPGTNYVVGDTLSLLDSQLGSGGGALLTFNVATTEEHWNVFSEGFNWLNVWTVNTRYSVNDIVRFGGTLYVANTGHTSAASAALGLEADQSKWDYLHKGIEYKSTHAINTRYKINDVVKYGGGTWICTTQHTSSATNLAADEANWAQFAEGLEFESSWAVGTAYQPGDVATYGGYSYISITNNVGLKPSDNAAAWDLFTSGFRFVGDYDVNAADLEYIEGDVARVGGYTYLCILKHTSQHPPSTTYWQRLNEGFEWKGTWANATEYDAGDSVQYGVNSYVCILKHASDQVTLQNRPDQDVDSSEWNLLVAGAESGNLTTAGDIVYYGGAGATRLPIGKVGQGLKVDSAGTAPEWAYFGQINNVFYVEQYAGVNDKAPNYGVTLDRPFKTIGYATEQVQSGAIRFNAKTLLQRNRHFIQDEVIEYIEAIYTDTATATTASTNAITVTSTSWLVAGETAVKFAATTFGNIVAGTEYFVKTILNATTFTVSATKGGAVFALATATGTSVVSLSYVQATCRRDTGQVLDAVIWDLSHGGNERSVAAAKAYFNAAGDTYIGGANASQTVAGFGYIVTVADAVMSNLAPATVRGSLARFTDATLTEEADALTSVTSLTSIVTSAITAGNTTGVPASIVPQNTIFVKTGNLTEVLPINVPENTAIVGDELRSTRINAAGSIINVADAPKTIDAISRLKAIIKATVTAPGTITKTTGNALNPVTTSPVGSVGSSGAVVSVVANANEIVDILVNDVAAADAIVFTDSGVAAKTTARTELQTNRAAIISALISWINTTYPSLSYNQAKCERDTGYIVDALSYDVQYGGNSATLVAAKAYFTQAGVSNVAGQVAETAAAIGQLVTITATYTSGSAEETQIATLLGITQSVITAGTLAGLPAEVTPVITWAAADLQVAHTALITARAEIQTDTVQHVKANFSGLVFNQVLCSRDTGLIVDALAYDLAFSSNYRSVTAGLAYRRGTASALAVIANQLAPTTSSIRFIKHKASGIAASGAGVLAETIVQDISDFINFTVSDVGYKTPTTGRVAASSSTDYTYGIESIEANRAFLVAEMIAYMANAHASYADDSIQRKRDTNAYIDAIQDGLKYIGNYKGIVAARYYSNAVEGSTTEDMFYMRNGTGLRNCTISGLSGTLGADNSYGTKRPTAGAFVSLDPGWGPNHTDAWIATKSPYIQNVTTFGTGCVGLKVDGDQHNGGNDSIVANDFTQIISDGIGAWITNLGRAELVSVFSYYGHIGYLAENGGKIRATNGNSSYGKYGTVAEGIDSTETAISAKVDNFANEAFASSVITDGDDILVIEYTNAGVGYTAGGTTFTITGEGYGAVVNSAAVVNGGVFEVRLTDPSTNFGGAGYVTNGNVAQEGNASQITISNTDTKLSSAYAGMAIYITGGVGAGQYAYIDSYNSGTKIAVVKKMSDNSAGWDHVTGIAPVTTLNATTTYVIEPRISFASPADNLYASTAKGRAVVEDGKIIRVSIWNPGVGYASAPAMTITDPSNTVEAPHTVRIGDGVLTQPTWTNRGTGMVTAAVTIAGDGYRDQFQPGTLINISNLSALPQAGANLTITGDSTYYKLVAIRNVQGGSAPYTAQFQVSPKISITDAPADDAAIEVRIRYSQVRLTGHDFLDVGTGNFTNTNYPGTPVSPAVPANETVVGGGGRIFYTTTDQDGNFRVGGLFNVEQSTGVATLNADAFNITGLNELQLGSVALGGTGATITEFSVDGTFTANSDNIVPTQKAIKTYITSQIGGGAGELNVNSITAGVVKISGQTITTTTAAQINITQKVNFTGGIKGAPVALNYFLSS